MSPSSPGPVKTSRRKSVLFTLIIVLSYVLLAEVVARVVLAGLAGSALPLAYGIDGEIKLIEHNTLRHPIFYRDCGDCADEIRPARVPGAGDRLAYAFGGSATWGWNCSPSASSWPDELDALGELRVKNMARNGTSSDYAVSALQAGLAEQTPDVVFWANWINELDILYEGPRRNGEKLAERFPDKLSGREGDFAERRLRYFLASLDRSFYLRSALYLFASKFAQRFATNRRVDASRGKPFDKRDAELAVANTMINLEEALALSRRHGFRLIVVRLPVNWPLMDQRFGPQMAAFARDWNDRLTAAIRDFAATRAITLLDVHERLEAEAAPAEIYCDAVHLRIEGHRIIARAIDAMLREEAGE